MFGQPYGSGPHYVTPDGTSVTMWRKGQRVRYLDDDGNQVGPEHANVVPAVVYAAYHAWVDPKDPLLSLAMTGEVRAKAVLK